MLNNFFHINFYIFGKFTNVNCLKKKFLNWYLENFRIGTSIPYKKCVCIGQFKGTHTYIHTYRYDSSKIYKNEPNIYALTENSEQRIQNTNAVLNSELPGTQYVWPGTQYASVNLENRYNYQTVALCFQVYNNIKI